jgi:uncharacterized protein (TIGR00645 family)
MPARSTAILRSVLFGCRWGMAPFCLGLIAALLILLAEFFRELAHILFGFAEFGGSAIIPPILKLVDLVLIANLVVMIIVAGAAAFLPAAEGDGEANGVYGLAALKPKLFGSISAIAAVELLETFMNLDARDKSGVLWETVILLAFVVSGVLLAWMDRLAERH